MKRLLLLTPFIFFLANLRAQTIDVDPYTGGAVVNLNLWNVTSGSLSYPVSLVYSNSGARAEAFSNRVGMGWNLVAGGAIIRELKCLPDDYTIPGTPTKEGWLVNANGAAVRNFNPVADENYSICTDEENDFNALNAFVSTGGSAMKDTEPDVFSINVAGLSGRFIFDHTGVVKFLEKTDIKVTVIFNEVNHIVGFIIINNRGDRYRFGLPVAASISSSSSNEAAITHFRYEYDLYKVGISYNAFWRLLSVESVAGDKIEFEYGLTQGNTVTYQGYPVVITSSPPQEVVNAFLYNPATDSYVKKTQFAISRIFPNALSCTKVIGQNSFVKILGGSVVLPQEEIKITQTTVGTIEVYESSTSNILKRFNLDYAALLDVEATNGFGKLLLNSVTEQTPLISLPPTVFRYYGVDYSAGKILLSEGSDRRSDQFGFLNANVIPGKTFESYIYPDLQGANQLRNDPIVGYSGRSVRIEGNPNTVDLPGLLVGSLSEVIFPAGGRNRVYFEPVMYKDEISGQSLYGGGLRVRRVEYHDGIDYSKDIVKDYTYLEAGGQSSGVLLFRPFRAYRSNYHLDPTTGVATYLQQLQTLGLSDEQMIKRTTVLSDARIFNNSMDVGQLVAHKRVSMYQPGKGKTVMEFQIPGSFGTETEPSWSASRTRIARDNPTGPGISGVTCTDIGIIAGSYSFPFPPNPNIDYARGLTRKITHYNETGNPVEETIYDYVDLAPEKQYGLKLGLCHDRLDFISTVNNEQGQPVQVAQTQSMPMFLFSKYEINVNSLTRLVKTTNVLYDQANPSKTITDVINYEYGSTFHDFVTKVSKTGSDGVIYATSAKYPHDYTISGQWGNVDAQTKALIKLREKNIVTKVESITTKKEGLENPLMIKAQLSLFEYDELTDRIITKKVLDSSPIVPVSILPSAVLNNGTSSVFQYENSKYTGVTEFLDYANNGISFSKISDFWSKSGIHADIKSGRTVLQLTNALASECVFSDFDSSSPFSLVCPSANTIVIGRLGKGINLTSGAAGKMTKDCQKGSGGLYKVSCWLKSSGSGTLTIRIKDQNNAIATGSIPITSTSGNWKYFSQLVDVSALGNSLTVEVESSSVVQLDDLIAYPEAASFLMLSYGKGGLKAAETNSRGESTFYEYDDIGRLNVVRDKDKNVVRAMTYVTKGATLGGTNGNRIDINVGEATVNSATQILPVGTSGFPGALFKWRIVKLADHIQNNQLINDFTSAVSSNLANGGLSYTFVETGEWMINLEVVYQGITTRSATIKKISVKPISLTGTICSNRPSVIDICAAPVLISTCGGGPTNNLVLTAQISNGSGTMTYAWRRAGSTSNLSTTASYISQAYLFDEQYTCTVTEVATGRTCVLNFEIRVFTSSPNCQ